VVAPGLQHHADPCAPPFVTLGRVDAEHADLARRAHPEALQDLHRGGLAGAVRPQQRDHLAAAHGEVDPREHVPGSVAHAQATNVDHRVRRAVRSELAPLVEHGHVATPTSNLYC